MATPKENLYGMWILVNANESGDVAASRTNVEKPIWEAVYVAPIGEGPLNDVNPMRSPGCKMTQSDEGIFA